MRIYVMILCLSLSFAACATIEHKTKAEQPVGQQLISGVGDVVLRINKQRNLENAFGKADLFGRKTNEGYSEIRFAGIEQNGEVVLYRHDVRIMTNETTMSRPPVFSTTTGSARSTLSGNYQGITNTANLNAASQANISSITLAPATDYHIVVPAETIPIRVRPGENRVPIEGYLIEIIKATPVSLEYRINNY
ncbi:MAG: hypothetical protein WCD80_07140 [Desulfobaccales bacterium]